MENKALEDKFLGCSIGSALGDALGEYWTFGSGVVFKKKGLFKHYIENIKKEYKYTDDTHMALGILYSISKKNKLNSNHVMKTFVDNYLDEGVTRGYGVGTQKVLKNVIHRKLSYEKAAQIANSQFDKGYYGNGSAMRTHIVGLYSWNLTDEEIYKNAEEISKLTHLHPLAIDGSAILSKAVSLCIKSNNIDVNQFIDTLIDFAKTGEFKAKLIKIKELLNRDVSFTHAASVLGTSVQVHNSVPYAIYCFLKYKDSYNKTLMASTQPMGDSDTIAAISCSLSGAYLGLKSINPKYYEKLENVKTIKILTKHLVSICQD